jgi:hypothetical protein
LLKKLKMIFFQKNKLKNFGNFGVAKTTPNGSGGGQKPPPKILAIPIQPWGGSPPLNRPNGVVEANPKVFYFYF